EQARRALELLGVALPDDLSDVVVQHERESAAREMMGRSDDDIVASPTIEDPVERATLQLLVAVATAAWFTVLPLFKVASFRSVAFTTSHGRGADSPFALSLYAIALVFEGDYEQAYRFAQLAARLAARADDAAQECRVLMVLGEHVGPWRAPLRDSIP